MPGKVLFKAIGMLFAAATGMFATIIVATPIFWYMNETANDGPLFPPPLVALGFLALPYAVLLFPLQALTALYELLRKQSPGLVSFLVGITNGLLAGFLWSLVLNSSLTQPSFVAALVGGAVLQSLTAVGVSWLVHALAPSARQLLLALASRVCKMLAPSL